MIAHLINTDIGNRGITNLYLEYRSQNFNFLKNAADILLKNYERTLIVTGFPIPPTMVAETDGPPGTVAIYRAVESLGGQAEVLTYSEVEKALRPFGIQTTKEPQIGNYSLVIAVETPGKTSNGKYYSMNGLEITRETFDWTVEEARELGIPTIGIGDGGNEAGMGKIHELVKKYIPHGERIGSTVETDELVLSAVSNWGAYGLIGEAALRKEELRDVLQGIDERGILKSLAMNGAIDGVTKNMDLSVDGIPEEVHQTIVQLIMNILKKIDNP
ncbi:glutamate cyclase domain-containing protein [Thermococcus sp.]